MGMLVDVEFCTSILYIYFISECSLTLWLLKLYMYIIELPGTLYIEFICICDYNKFHWVVILLVTTF
jgi:hypothetical protein